MRDLLVASRAEPFDRIIRVIRRPVGGCDEISKIVEWSPCKRNVAGSDGVMKRAAVDASSSAIHKLPGRPKQLVQLDIRLIQNKPFFLANHWSVDRCLTHVTCSHFHEEVWQRRSIWLQLHQPTPAPAVTQVQWRFYAWALRYSRNWQCTSDKNHEIR